MIDNETTFNKKETIDKDINPICQCIPIIMYSYYNVFLFIQTFNKI